MGVDVHQPRRRGPEPAPPDVDIWILGPLRIRLGGREAALRGTRIARLAALLSVNADAVVPYERIVDVLWDEPPESARQQVHNVVGALRRALARPGGAPLVLTEGAGYRLAVPQTAVDAFRFQAAAGSARQALAEGREEQALATLHQGLSLWRGPALTGLRDSRLANAATVLDEQRLDAVEAATGIRLRLGAADATLGELSALVAEHPFRESLRALLMRALLAASRQADALTVYEEGRRLLADELGLDPGPQLRRAHEAVLRGEVPVGPVVPAVPAPIAVVPPPRDDFELFAVSSDGPVTRPAGLGAPAAGPTPQDVYAHAPVIAHQATATAVRFDPATAGTAGTGTTDALTSLTSPNGNGATAAAPPTVPAPRIDRSFLPRDLSEFIGREHHIRALEAQAGIGGPAPQVAVIDGMGGVGKSTLAVHVAHRLAPLFPDGHYFVDLSGFCAVTEPVEPAQALEALLRASGLDPDSLPEGVDERSALWRARLAGRRALVLLDNARDAAQIRPLLPGTGETFVLITSRKRMPSLEGAVPVPLEVMGPDSAIALFSRIIGAARAEAEPDAVASAVELCGRLPLAIQVAAARLRDRATWPVERVAAQLADHRTRFLVAGDRDVTAILAWSYHQLAAPQKRLFRLLSLHPGPDFDAHTAAALTDTPLPDAESALEHLFEANLLQERAPGRYHLHDLVHDCSAELQTAHGDGQEQLQACERLIDHYLRAAVHWCAAMGTDGADGADSTDSTDSAVESASQYPDTHPGPGTGTVRRASNPAHARRLLETELGNFVAVRRLAVTLGLWDRARTMAQVLGPHFGLL